MARVLITVQCGLQRQWQRSSSVCAYSPKFGYAYDNNDAFVLKSDRIDSIIAYDKLDGSCIIQFRYYDADGHVYQSFKTRGMPFVSEDFKWMWDKVIAKYPFINEMLIANNTANICMNFTEC
jgi:hypothetical protein